MRRRLWLSLLLLPELAACKHDESAGASPSAAAPSASGPLLEAAEEAATTPARPQQKGAATAAGEKATIAAGAMTVGSTPGDLGRDPALEPAALAVTLGEFQIDKLP